MSNSWEDIPASGGGSGSNASVGTNGTSAPGSSTQIAYQNGSGNLTPVSPSAPLPVTIDGDIVIANVNLNEVGGSSISIGQQLSAASLPVVLPASQITSLTPPTTVTVQQSTAASLNATVVGTGTFATQAAQSGTWTVQPGNTANTTPWLSTINQGGNSATVTAANALKVDGSAVTQPISGTVTITPSGTQNVNLNQVGGSSISIGQQLAAVSLPVILPAATITTLTPPTTVTVTQSTAASLNATVVGTGTFAVQNTQQGTASQNVTQFDGTNISTGTGASGTGIPRVTVSNDSNILSTQSGTWNITNVSGTVSLPTGASTSALQTTGNTSLSTIATNTAGLALTQGSTTSGQTGNLTLGAVTTSAPSYTTGQTSPFSLDTSGNLRTVSAAPALPTTILNGQKTSTGTAVALPSGALTTGVLVSGLPGNAGIVYVGTNTVTTSGATGGMPLLPYQTTSVACANLNDVYFIAATSGDGVAYLGS